MRNTASGRAAAALFASSAIVPATAQASDTNPPGAFTVTGNVAVTSDYRFRGLSRSSGDPAVQGGLNLDHISGFYVSVWTSTINYEVIGQAADNLYGGQELDISGGWTGPVGGGLNADVGLLYYAFPDGRSGTSDFFEPYASLSTTLGPAMGKVGVKYAWKQEALNFNGGGKDDSLYVHADLSVGIPTTPVTLAGHAGFTDGALSPRFATGERATYDGGLDWSLGATWAVTRSLSLTGQYVGVEGASIDGFSNDTLVGTLKFSF